MHSSNNSLKVGVGEGVRVTVGVCEAVRVEVAVLDSVGDGVMVTVFVWVEVAGSSVRVAEAENVGVGVAVGVATGWDVRDKNIAKSKRRPRKIGMANLRNACGRGRLCFSKGWVAGISPA